jgi:LacI family transcriptional regulator
MPKNRTKVTMSDVARESGLSLSTVSLALNEKPGLPLETRMKVIEVAHDLGYQVRQVSGSSDVLSKIGMLVKRSLGDEAQPSSNIFFSHVIAGIEATCRKQNIALMYSSLPVDAQNNSLEIPRLVFDATVDGILLVGNYVDDRLNSAIHTRKVPIVLVDGYCNTNEYDSVVIDNVSGSYTAVEYLIQKGHRHIAFFGSYPDSRLSFRYRRQGYNQALRDYGIEERYFGDCAHNNREEVIATASRLLTQHPQITALFCCNDEVALMSMHGILNVGKRIPHDVSIIGFDNNTNSEISIPPLTTVDVDKVSMGRLAVQMLFNRAENPDQVATTLLLHTRLVVRQSVRDISDRQDQGELLATDEESG